MRLFIKSAETDFPEKKIIIQDLPQFSADEKSLLHNLGYAEFRAASPDNDALDLIIKSSKKSISAANMNASEIDIFFSHTAGTYRTYADYGVAAFLQSQIGLNKCPGLLLNSSCISMSTGFTLFKSLAQTDTRYKTAMVSTGTGYFPLVEERNVAVDLPKHRGLVGGAAGASLILTTAEGKIEILSVDLGFTYIKDDSWNIPSAINRFQYKNDRLVGGGDGYIAWKDNPEATQNKEYVAPVQMILEDIIQAVISLIAKFQITELSISCIPLGQIKIQKLIQASVGDKTQINLNNSIFQRFGHTGPSDLGIVICEAFHTGKPGHYCHINIGQGYFGSAVLFKVV